MKLYLYVKGTLYIVDQRRVHFEDSFKMNPSKVNIETTSKKTFALSTSSSPYSYNKV